MSVGNTLGKGKPAAPPGAPAEWFGVDVEDLSARLSFNPRDGHIWLEGERMMLLHVAAFAVLRQELVERLGIEDARCVFTRLGASAGARDAAIARVARPHAGPLEAFKAGPRLHAIEGICVPDEIRLEVDAEACVLSGEWIWRNSAEAEAHLQAMGPSGEPVCWTMIGYATAYSSTFMKHPIVFREVECRAMGAPHCRTVAKPAALWEADEEESRALGLALAEDGDGALVWDSEGEALDEWRDAEAEALAGRLTLLRRVVRLDEPVLLLGERGVGKLRLARALHRMGPRAGQPLYLVNCVRSEAEDLELELFGREKTATDPARPGRIERLKGGTLVLEDVEALSPRLQARLLQLLSDHSMERIGGGQARPADVRVIACATADLQRAVSDGTFRTDLYYRLSAFAVPLPPLRERRDELPRLIRHFAGHFAKRYDRAIQGLSREAMGYLLAHDYPGNVVELEAMLGRAVVMAGDDGVIQLSHLLSAADPSPPSFFRVSSEGALVHPVVGDPLLDIEAQTRQMIRGNFSIEAFETELVKRAVTQAGGNLAKAARLLGMTRAQLAYRHARIAGD